MYPEPIQTEILSIAPDRNGETGAECEIILPDYCPNVLRILQTDVSVTRKTCVPNADRLTVEGTAEFRILYLGEDGSGLSCVTQQTPFSCSLEAKTEEKDGFDVKIFPVACSARALTSQKRYARCTLQIRLRKDGKIPLPYLEDAAEYECKTETRTVATLLCTGEKPLRISDEFENETGKLATQICDCRVSFRETELKPLTDKLIVKGDMFLDLLCKAEDGALFSLRQTVAVSQILDMPNVGANPVCTVDFDLLYFTPSLREQPNGGQTVEYDTEIRVFCKAYGETEAEWVRDAYCAKKILDYTKTAFSVNRLIGVRESGSIRESVDIGSCTSILQATVTPEWKRLAYESESDALLCEGAWICKVLAVDGEGIQTALQREIPFRFQTPSEGCTNPIRNDTKVILTDLSWNLTDPAHLELRGTYYWNGLIVGQEKQEAVTEITVRNDRPRCEDTVTLCYAKAGESAWEIAKEYACPYGELMRTNELTEDKLESDRVLLILTN